MNNANKNMIKIRELTKAFIEKKRQTPFKAAASEVLEAGRVMLEIERLATQTLIEQRG